MNLACTLYFIVEAEEWWNFQEFTASFFDHANHLSRILVPKKYKIQHVVQYTFFEFYADYINTSFCDKKAPKTSYFEKYFFFMFWVKTFQSEFVH